MTRPTLFSIRVPRRLARFLVAAGAQDATPRDTSASTDTSSVTRFEVIDYTGAGTGRMLTRDDVTVELSLQDDGRTLKAFLRDHATDMRLASWGPDYHPYGSPEITAARRDNIILRLGRLDCTHNVDEMTGEEIEQHWHWHLEQRNGAHWRADR